MKVILLFFLKLYKFSLSPLLELLFGKACRFTPTCSEYAIEAISKYGTIKGGNLAIRRFFRCNPRSPGGFDPVQ